MKIVPTKSAKNEFLALYRDAFENTLTMTKGDPARLYNLRCSQLPYCPASVLLNYGERGMIQAMDLSMAFYVGVGHAVHHAMQRYLSQSGKFLANYKCHECGKVHKLSHTIECCGFPTEYDEIDLDVNGVQGHIDLVFLDRNKDYWIMDLKTTSLAASEEKAKRPPESYRRQVRAYAYLLYKQYKIRVKGLMLVFIPRDNPKEPTIWEFRINTNEKFDDFKRELLEDKRLHSRTMSASTLEEMRPLLRHNCGGEYCNACKLPMKEKIRRIQKYIARGRYPIK